ncbi:hypothetical protein [Mycolicibacterium cosmeticum]|uniref:hypothetical protein n=1 Tax=Mycolicibacterium cosmeticum TaxID=258533 RepID=UPI003204B195
MRILALPLVLAAVVLAACGSSPAPAPVTVTNTNTVTVEKSAVAAPAATIAPIVETPVAAAVGIVIPDIPVGTNAAIVESKLEALGLTNVELASANADYTNVFLPKNWTLVSIEPSPGSHVQASDPVIVKVTKP